MKYIIKGVVVGVCLAIAGTNAVDEPLKFLLLSFALIIASDDDFYRLIGVIK